MTNLQLLFAAGFPTIAVLIGILLNRSDANGIRSELAAVRGDLSGRIDGVRNDLSGRIDMLTGKVIELMDRVSHLEARIG